MRKRSIIAFLLLGLASIIQASPSIVYGNLDGGQQTIEFQFPTDYISDNSISIPLELRPDGSFRIEFDIDEALKGSIIIGTETLHIFIHPNDSLSIEGNIFTDISNIRFSGKYQKENTYLNQYKQPFSSESAISYEMISKSFEDFKKTMEKQYLSYKKIYYQTRANSSFSDRFALFALSEIEYSYAYYLLRYRIEHPLGNGTVPPLELPNDYLSTVYNVVINNSNAFISSAYRRFIKEYVSLIREKDNQNQVLPIEENFLVRSKSSPVFAQPDVPPIHSSLQKGQMVKFLKQRSDFKSKSRIGGETSEDYWYHVQLNDGKKGWILGHTIEKIQKAKSKNQKAIKKEVTTKSKVVTYAISLYDKLAVYNDPNDRKIITHLGYGQEVGYPHVSTTEQLNYHFQGLNMLGKFVMVDIDGLVGWVFESGIRTQNKVVQTTEKRQIVTLAALKNYSFLDQYLSGNTLYFAIAQDLYHRFDITSDGSLEVDVQNFLSVSQNSEANEVIRSRYEEYFGSTMIEEHSTKNQLVSVTSSHISSDAASIISSSKFINEDFQLTDNYVILPERNVDDLSIETRIALPSSGNIELSILSDPLAQAYTVYRPKLNGQGSEKSLVYDQINQEFGKLKFNGRSYPIILKPGADITYSLDQDGVLFSSHSPENHYLIDAHNTFRLREKLIGQKIRNSSIDDFKNFVNGLTKQKRIHLKEYSNRYAFDDSFLIDMTYDIEYWMGHQLLRYIIEHPKYDKSWSLPNQEEDYFAFLDRIDINPINRTLGTNYGNFIKAYLTHIKDKAVNRNIPFKQLIERTFNGYSYYYLMSLELYADIFRVNALQSGKDIARFIQHNPYAKLNRSLITTYNANLPLSAGVTAPYFELIDQNGQLVTNNELLGKVVVLDFWATWCAPCLEKMRTDQQITSKYNSNEVVFLYVSLDTDSDNWQRFLKINPGIKGLHAMPNSGVAFDSSVAQNYKVSSIPAFYIIGKDGRLAYSPFTTLSPSRIRDHIDNLLNPR